MKVSIVTSVYNGNGTIEECISSVLNQSYRNIEYIVVDGKSNDGTTDVIKKYKKHIAKIINEPDKGLYDALNKGIEAATGDVVGFLHSDDFYPHENVIQNVVSHMNNCDIDSCYGDLVYVAKRDRTKIVRYWKSAPFNDGLFKKGWMPPHPTFFVKREIYTRYGSFNTQFKIAADYELMLRFLAKNNISSHYIPEILVIMRTGGRSNKSLKNILITSREDYNAWKVNNIKGGFHSILLKKLCKIPQFINKSNGLHK